jgi:hypothetical protein
MSETIDWGWVQRTLLSVQAEQRMLRSLVEPLPGRMSALEERFGAMEARFGAIEARFRALEARFGGIEEGIQGIGLTLRLQGELLAQVLKDRVP